MESKEKEARGVIEKIQKICGEERPVDLAVRAKNYASAIRAMNKVAKSTGDTEIQDAAFLAIEDFAGYAGEIIEDMHTVVNQIAGTASEYLERPEFQAHTPTEEELRDIYREKRTNVKTQEPENKQHILDLLLPALQATRHLENLAILDYDAETECVKAFFSSEYGGCVKIVNVACDSGIAMIRDVLGGLG